MAIIDGLSRSHIRSNPYRDQGFLVGTACKTPARRRMPRAAAT